MAKNKNTTPPKTRAETAQTKEAKAKTEQAKEEKMAGIPQFDETWKFGIFLLLPFFINRFFPKLYEQIDWSVPPLDRSNEILQKQFKKRFKKKFPDLVIQVQLKPKEGKPARLLILHFEIQATSDRFFTRRIFRYNLALRKRTKLSVCSIGILVDESETWLPKAFLRKVFGTKLVFTNKNIKIATQRAIVEILMKDNDPNGWFLAAYFTCRDTKYDEKNRQQTKLDLIKSLTSAKIEDELREILFVIIDGLLNLSLKLQADFDSELEKLQGENSMKFITQSGIKWFNEGKEEGKSEGKTKWKAEGEAKVLALALKLKYEEPGTKFAKKLIGINNLEILDSIYQGIEAGLPLSELKKLLKPKASVK